MESLGLVEIETTAGYGKQCGLYSKFNKQYGDY